MPRYISPIGVPCTADDAMSAGRIRPGYTEIMEDGESIPFSVALMDAPSSKAAVYLTDNIGKQLSHARYGCISDCDLSRMKEAEEAAYQRSKASLNDWRKDTAGSAAAVSAIRDARWL